MTLKAPLESIQNQIHLLYSCLQDHLNSLNRQTGSIVDQIKSQAAAKEGGGGVEPAGLAAFSKKGHTTETSENWFLTEVELMHPSSKKRIGRPSDFSASVARSKAAIVRLLRIRKDYDPVFLTDDAMGIDSYAMEKNDSFMSTTQRASYRTRFREELVAGVENMKLNIYCKSGGGARQACVFVWKVPATFAPGHTARAAAVMEKCQELAPKEISRELVTHFNLMMAQISGV